MCQTQMQGASAFPSSKAKGRAVKGGLNTLRCTMGSANAAGACTMRSDSDTAPVPGCACGASPYACACAVMLSTCRHEGAGCAARDRTRLT